MSKRTLKDVIEKILEKDFENIKETIYASDDFEVINAIYECLCGFYWTGNSIRVGIIDGEDNYKDKVCYNCGLAILQAKRILKGKIKLQSPKMPLKPEIVSSFTSGGGLKWSGGGLSEETDQATILAKANLTLSKAIEIMNIAQMKADYIMNNLPDRDSRDTDKRDRIKSMLTGKNNFRVGLDKGWIKSSKQSYRIKQFRDILKKGGFLRADF